MLTGFTASLLLITVSELGDKTFFIAAILAMRHPRRFVFIGATAALATMTILSVMMGQVASLLPETYVRWAEVLLFMVFGLKMLYDAGRMSESDICDVEEQSEAVDVVKAAELKLKKGRNRAVPVITQAFGLTFLAEWGDRTQIATIAMAAANHPVAVTLGATLGHALCALLAVQCGRWVCGRISERTITTIGGGLFLLFATVGFARLVGWLS